MFAISCILFVFSGWQVKIDN